MIEESTEELKRLGIQIITLVITEGFGKMAMAHRTFDLLKSKQGMKASVNGATQIRAGVMRPEVIVPLIGLFLTLVISKAVPLFRLMQKKVDRINQVMRETLAGVRVIRAFVRTDHEERRFDEANVDALTMWLLKNPFNYDVLVAPNLYGDIISDLCAQMVGGLGFGCSGNIGDKLAVFEPTHGSAPKYAGMHKVNPIATILAAKMMLDWLGQKDKADAVERATAAVIAEGRVRTYDMGGSDSTLEMAQAIADRL